MLVFEWDPGKARRNLQKHGVAFDEAVTVCDEPLAAIFQDQDHSADEEREIIVGYSILNRLLLVCFTERPRDRVRILSARVATAQERRRHEENIGK